MLSKAEQLQNQGDTVYWYLPHGADQEAYWKSEADIRWMLGGNQCLGGEQLIYDPVENVKRLVSCINKPFHVYAYDGQRIVVAKAGKPFKKTPQQLYVLGLSNGQSIVCSGKHLMLSPSGWQQTSELQVGSSLFQPPSISDSDQDVCVPCNSPKLNDSIAVTSVDVKRFDDIWDFNVPVYHNYLAAGVIHHNSGKTYTNMMDLTKTVLDINPCEKRNVVGDHWAGIETWDMVRDILWEGYLQKFIPAYHIKHIRWGPNKVPHKLFLDTGHTIEFKAFKQGRETFQGRAIQSAHYDEQCLHDFQGIFNETQARLMTKQGYLSWSMTPIMPQSLLEERIEDLPETDEVFCFNLNDNRKSQGGYIDDQRIDDKIAEWPEEVQATRIEGKFASFYGAVYKSFNRSIHVIEPFKIPSDWTLYRGIDFGYTNPFACLWIAKDNDENWYVYREYFKKQTGIQEHIANIRARSVHESYQATIVDTEDPEKREIDLRNAGIKTTNAVKDIDRGVELVQGKLKVKANGKPSLYIFNTCKNIPREMAMYHYPEGTSSKDPADHPVKKDDHTCFIAGTLVETSEGPKSIEKVKVGDSVLTRYGYHRVVASGMTCSEANVMTAEFSNGVTLTGTPNHRIFIKQKDFISLADLRYGDIIQTCKLKSSYIKALNTTDIPIRQDSVIGCIIHHVIQISLIAIFCIKQFGKILMRRFPKVIAYTTRMAMQAITSLRILNVYHANIMHNFIARNANLSKKPVLCADGFTVITQEENQADSALIIAEQGGVATKDLMMKSESVHSVRNNLRSINTINQNVVPVFAVNVSGVHKQAPVYNITVDVAHEFFANGILVSNCDALRYVLYTVCRPRKKGTVVAA